MCKERGRETDRQIEAEREDREKVCMCVGGGGGGGYTYACLVEAFLVLCLGITIGVNVTLSCMVESSFVFSRMHVSGFRGMESEQALLMSHGDSVGDIAQGFHPIANSGAIVAGTFFAVEYYSTSSGYSTCTLVFGRTWLVKCFAVCLHVAIVAFPYL